MRPGDAQPLPSAAETELLELLRDLHVEAANPQCERPAQVASRFARRLASVIARHNRTGEDP